MTPRRGTLALAGLLLLAACKPDAATPTSAHPLDSGTESTPPRVVANHVEPSSPPATAWIFVAVTGHEVLPGYEAMAEAEGYAFGPIEFETSEGTRLHAPAGTATRQLCQYIPVAGVTAPDPCFFIALVTDTGEIQQMRVLTYVRHDEVIPEDQLKLGVAAIDSAQGDVMIVDGGIELPVSSGVAILCDGIEDVTELPTAEASSFELVLDPVSGAVTSVTCNASF